MGENGAAVGSCNTTNNADAAAAAAMAVATGDGGGGAGDWSNLGGYAPSSGMLSALSQHLPATGITPGSNLRDLSLPSCTASTTNMTSPYAATLLAAVAAAAAAAYPVQQVPPSSVQPSAGQPFLPNVSVNSSSAADYGTMYYRSAARQPSVSSATPISGMYANGPYPAVTMPTWPYSVSPNQFAASSAMVDRVNGGMVQIDGWSTPTNQQPVTSQGCSDMDPNNPHSQQIPQGQYPQVAPGSINMQQKDLPNRAFYTPPHMRTAVAAATASGYANSDTTNQQQCSSDEFSVSYPVAQTEAKDRSFMSASSHPAHLVNGSVNGQVPFFNPFLSIQQQKEQQQQQMINEFNRLAVNNSGGELAGIDSESRAGVLPAQTRQLDISREQSVHTTSAPQWLYSNDGSNLSNERLNSEQSARGTRTTRPTVSNPMMLTNQGFTDSPRTGQMLAGPVIDPPRAKTWANIAGQPPKGSAAVLMNSTGWSAKRVPGHVLTSSGNRSSAPSAVIPSTASKPASSINATSNTHENRHSPNHSKTDEQKSPSFNSNLGENPNNSLSGNSRKNATGGYDDSLEALRESEALHQRLAKSINPTNFDTNVKKARFFVIKSFSEDDIHRSIKYSIWCSTALGNKKLDAAFAEANSKYPIYLFFSVNGSGHFCGMAEMTSRVDHSTRAMVWAQDKWQGAFSVRWIFVKDVPNTALRHIRVETNENKPVTHSRDTTELPLERGRQVMEVFATYSHTLSLFDDFVFYEERERQEGARRKQTTTRRG
ncbi:unnamed protein product [Calicophoron daubneyi]